jgi:ribA/ribD-fused uncharacterized protein
MKWIKNWFSNFDPMDKPMYHDGLLYKTVEHFFVAMKTEDTDERAKIAALPSATAAKQYGRKLKLRNDWEMIKESAMWTALIWKYRPGTIHSNQLFSTGNWDIVEWNNWHDNYWGACICPKCHDKEKKNRLGVLLMQLREGLQKGYI